MSVTARTRTIRMTRPPGVGVVGSGPLLHLDVLGVEEDGRWSAIALDMSIADHGDTFEEALESLRDALKAQFEFAFSKEGARNCAATSSRLPVGAIFGCSGTQDGKRCGRAGLIGWRAPVGARSTYTGGTGAGGACGSYPKPFNNVRRASPTALSVESSPADTAVHAVDMTSSTCATAHDVGTSSAIDRAALSSPISDRTQSN